MLSVYICILSVLLIIMGYTSNLWQCMFLYVSFQHRCLNYIDPSWKPGRVLYIAKYLYTLGCRFTYQITDSDTPWFTNEAASCNLLTDYLCNYPELVIDWLEIGYRDILGIYTMRKDFKSLNEGIAYTTVLGAIAARVNRDPSMLHIFSRFIEYMAENAASFGGEARIASYICQSGAVKQVLRSLPKKHIGKRKIKGHLQALVNE